MASSPAAAEVRASEQAARQGGTVAFEIAGVYEYAQSLEESLRELMWRLRLMASFRDEPLQSPVIARVRVEFFSDSIHVTVDDGRHRLPQVRRVVSRAESPAVVRETLAHVVLGAVEPLTMTTEPPPGLTRPEQPPQPPISRESRGSTGQAERGADSTSQRRRPITVLLTAAAGTRVFSWEGVTPCFVGGAGLALPSALEPTLFVQAGYMVPMDLHKHAIDATLRGTAIHAGARISPVSTRTVQFDTGASLGVDMVSVTPTATEAHDDLKPSTTHFQPTVGGFAALRTRLTRALSLKLQGGVDVDIKTRRWVIERSTGDATFFELERLRPYLQLGLELAVLGSSAPDRAEE